MTQDTYAIVVPVLNESVKIRRVLERIRDAGHPDVVVVDDGSSDDSAQVAKELGAHVISLGKTEGVGIAILTGMQYVKDKGFTYCVIMAGNNKDEPKEVPQLLELLIRDEADFVQGSRWLKGGGVGGEMPYYRKWATRLHPWLFSLLSGKRLTESTNGFRAFRSSLLDDERIRLDQPWLKGYEMEPYFLFKVIRLGYRHREIPCTKIYPPKKQGNTKMRPVIDWWNILRPIVLLGLGVKR